MPRPPTGRRPGRPRKVHPGDVPELDPETGEPIAPHPHELNGNLGGRASGDRGSSTSSTTRRRGGARVGAGRPLGGANLAGLRQELAEEIAWLGMAASMVFPLTGTVIVNRAEITAGALVDLAAKDKRLLRLLMLVAQGGAYAVLGGVVTDVVVAVGVERGAVPLESVLTMRIRPEIDAVQAQLADLQARQQAAQQVPGGSIGTEAERAASQG